MRRPDAAVHRPVDLHRRPRSEEHTSELQSRQYLVCRLLPEKTKIPCSPPAQPAPSNSSPSTAASIVPFALPLFSVPPSTLGSPLTRDALTPTRQHATRPTTF